MSDNIKQHIALPSLGMRLTSNPLDCKEGEALFILNGVPKSGSTRNAFGTVPVTYKLDAGFKLITNQNIDKNRILVFSVNPATGESAIGIIKNNESYKSYIISKKLNFKLHKPIRCAIKIDYNKHVIVYFTDDYNPRRRIDLDNIPMIDGDIDIDSIEVSAKYVIPDMKVVTVTEDGGLLSGGYYIFGQYADANGNALSSAFTPIGPIPISKNSVSDSSDFIEGIDSNIPTTKAIVAQFDNLDKSFDYYNVGLIHVANGISKAYIVQTVPINQDRYIITGQGQAPLEVDLRSIIEPSVNYTHAKTVQVVNNDVLMWGGLKTRKLPNLQKYFLNAEIQWVSQKFSPADNNENHVNPVNCVYRKVFRFNEVYALGCVLLFTDGTKSQVFHFPGRRKNKMADGTIFPSLMDQFGNQLPQGDWDSYKGYVGNDVTNDQDKERWELFSTATNSGNTGNGSFGECGYYQSTDRYPNNPDIWGDLAGTPILFHRMPDYNTLPLIVGTGENGVNTNPQMHYLGVRIRNIENIISSLPEDVKKDIQGFEIVVAKRDFNKSVKATGLLYNNFFSNWKQQDSGTDDIRMYPNYPFNDLNPDGHIAKAPIGNDRIRTSDRIPNDRIRHDAFTFLSPDTTLSKASLTNSVLQIHGECYGKADIYWKHLSPYPRFFDRNNSGNDDAAAMVIGTAWYNNFTKTRFGNARRKLKEAMYVPFNVQSSSGNIGMNFHNATREATVLLGVDKNLLPPIIKDNSRLGIDGPLLNCTLDRTVQATVSSYIATVYQFIQNQYGGIHSIEYTYTNYNHYNVNNDSIVYGGDTYIGRFASRRQLVNFPNPKAFMNLSDGDKSIRFRNNPTLAHFNYWYQANDNNARNDSRLMCQFGQFLGVIPMIHSGIVIMYGECDYNLNYRQNGTAQHETFYPNLQNGAMNKEEFLGILHVDKDNFNKVNQDFSAPNNFATYNAGSPLYNPNDEAEDLYGRVIYSLDSSAEQMFDNWRIYLPLNYYDFPKTAGRIIDIRQTGQFRTLFRLEHGIYMDEIYTGLEANGKNLYLGDGRLFQRKPVPIISSDNFDGGTDHAYDFCLTPFGAFFTSATLGRVYQFSDKLAPIHVNGATSFFRDNLELLLPSQIDMKDDIDSFPSPEGIGFNSVFLEEFALWVLTKKDYELVNPENRFRYKYEDGRFYFDGAPISVHDSSHFINKSWTIAYAPATEHWYSFYSFIPDFYMSINKQFMIGHNREASAVIENYSEDVFCTYFGKTYEYIIQVPFLFEGLKERYNLWMALNTKAFKVIGPGRKVELKDVTFQNAILFNGTQCSGNLRLQLEDENNIQSIISFKSVGSDYRDIPIRRRSATFYFSDIYDLVKSNFGNKGFFSEDWNDIKDDYFIDQVLVNSELDYNRGYTEELLLSDLYLICRLSFKEKSVELYTYLLSLVDSIENI